jgi:tRNA A-37 threonylcarbamoyl transferase component Bud32
MEVNQSNTNIRGYTENHGRIFFDSIEEVASSNGFITHWGITHFFYNIFGQSQEVKLAENKVAYINISSFNEWKTRNFMALLQYMSNETLNQTNIQDIIHTLQRQLCSQVTSGWGIDKANTIYRLKQSENGSGVNEDSYLIGNLLGRGHAGEVRALHPNGKTKEKAIKIFTIKFCDSSGTKDYASKEYEILKKIPQNSTGLIRSPKFFIPQSGNEFLEKEALLVMPKYDGELNEDIISNISFKEKIEVINQLIQGISTLHQFKICHRDINLNNVLFVKKQGKMRYDFCDFELSKENANKKDIKKDILLLGILLKGILDGKKYLSYHENKPFNEEEIEKYLNLRIPKKILTYINEMLTGQLEKLEPLTL